MSEIKIDLLQIITRPGALNPEERRILLDALHDRDYPPRMTFDEFLEWSDEDMHAEWVRGEVIVTSPASDQHQNIASFLTAVLRIFVETRNCGIIRPAPFQMKIANEISREPDILFLAEAHRARLKPTYLDGPADLVVEIISPESVGRDRGEKFYEYEQAGIPEYWLIDPQRQQAEFYRLEANGRYHLSLPDENDIYRATALPGFWLKVTWLWGPPPVLEVCKELGLV